MIYEIKDRFLKTCIGLSAKELVLEEVLDQGDLLGELQDQVELLVELQDLGGHLGLVGLIQEDLLALLDHLDLVGLLVPLDLLNLVDLLVPLDLLDLVGLLDQVDLPHQDHHVSIKLGCRDPYK